jgi:hypothetical protein
LEMVMELDLQFPTVLPFVFIAVSVN